MKDFNNIGNNDVEELSDEEIMYLYGEILEAPNYISALKGNCVTYPCGTTICNQ